ncbi:squamosa promoter binding protein [Trifolium repens]|nr:squamosa promoter binding protein [Trifolium repens]
MHVTMHWHTEKNSGKNNDSNCDGEAVLLDPEEELVAIGLSTPETQIIKSDSAVSFVASAEPQVNIRKDASNLSKSPSYCDYSSMCQTCRIFFMLYDWNPAEFPRRL